MTEACRVFEDAAALPHPLERWLPEVDALVGALRGTQGVRFSIEKVALRAEVTVDFRVLEGRLRGVTLNRNRMLLRRDLRPADANFTFAHELAHILCRRGHFDGLRPSEEEWFADWFGREMLLPRAWLRPDWQGSQLAALHVDRMTALLQLAAAGLAPRIMRYGDRILCRTCGTHHHVWGCECRVMRAASPLLRRRLPEAPAFAGPRCSRYIQLEMQALDASPGLGQAAASLVDGEEAVLKAVSCSA